jgi:hypothetical protein
VTTDRDTGTGQELEPVPGEYVVPLTGELVALSDPLKVAAALEHVRDLKHVLDGARVVLEDALRLESVRQGTRTLHLGDLDAVVSGGERLEYDHVELIVEVVSYKVDERVARSVSASNPVYAAALERCRRTVPAPWRVSVKRGGGVR